MPASRTSPACISGVNHNNGDTGEFRLVSYKLPQLEKRPTVHSGSLRFTGLHTFANIFEIFKNNSAFGAFGFLDDFLGNAMINVSVKIRLLSSDFFKMAFSGFRTARLKCFAKIGKTCSVVFDYLPGKGLSIGACGDFYKVGKLNYHPHSKTINWPELRENVIDVLQAYDCEFMLKKDLMEA